MILQDLREQDLSPWVKGEKFWVLQTPFPWFKGWNISPPPLTLFSFLPQFKMYPGPQHPRRIKVQREAPGLLSPQLHMVRMWQNPNSVLNLQSFSYRRRKQARQIHPCVAKRSVLLVQLLMQIPSGVGVSWDPRASPRAVSFRGWEITDENWPGWWVQEVVTNGSGHWQWVQDPY